LTCASARAHSKRKDQLRIPDMSDLTVYSSVPLELGRSLNIRLLTLLRSDQQLIPGPISCTLRIAQLDKSLPYTAVSYVWGAAEPTENILINGRPFTVRQNLWHLLDQVRRENYQGDLWIDAIAIDQSSDDERSHQVAMMGHIYSHAVEVLSWLGTPSKQVVDAVMSLPRQSQEQDTTSGTKDRREAYLLGMQWILANDYWQRVWILQEVLLARKITLHCSNAHIVWEALSFVDQYLNGPCGKHFVPEIQWGPATILKAQLEYRNSSQNPGRRGFDFERLMSWIPDLGLRGRQRPCLRHALLAFSGRINPSQDMARLL
jgi:hypothetical protein